MITRGWVNIQLSRWINFRLLFRASGFETIISTDDLGFWAELEGPDDTTKKTGDEERYRLHLKTSGWDIGEVVIATGYNHRQPSRG